MTSNIDFNISGTLGEVSGGENGRGWTEEEGQEERGGLNVVL